MKTTITAIGNSKGIRIPASILRQCEFGDEVELEVQGHQLIVRAAHPARHGWAESLAASKPSPLLIDDALDLPADNEWKW